MTTRQGLRASLFDWRTFRRLPTWHVYQPAKNIRIPGTAESLVWSGKGPPPEVGQVIAVRAFSTTAEVRGYFTEAGFFLGLRLRLADPPGWFVRQNGRRALCHVYGAEVSP